MPRVLRGRDIGDPDKERVARCIPTRSPTNLRLVSGRGSTKTVSLPEKGKVVTTLELRKQISIFVPLSDWRAIRYEAARRNIPMTELCRRWMKPELSRLRNGESKQTPETRDRFAEQAEN